MTVREYYVGDANALTLKGENGSLATLLEAYLVDGHDVYPAAGWTKPYELSTVKVLRCGAGSNQRYLQLSDNLVSSGALAKVVGYETMTAYDTGTNPFPSAGQVVDGLRVWKSIVDDDTNRLWNIVATESMLYLFTGPDNELDGQYWSLFAFGDFNSYLSGDTDNTIIIGREHATNKTTGTAAASEVMQTISAINAAGAGHYCVRSYTGAGTSLKLGKSVYDKLSGMSYPNPADGGLYLLPIHIHEPSGVLRGALPGLYWLPQTSNITLNHRDTFDGTGTLSGKTFRYMRIHGIRLAVEISDTW